jgi:hypothetical protein
LKRPIAASGTGTGAPWTLAGTGGTDVGGSIATVLS